MASLSSGNLVAAIVTLEAAVFKAVQAKINIGSNYAKISASKCVASSCAKM